MHLVYIDDSKDEQTCVFSALLIPAEKWREIFQSVKEYRQYLRDTYGISIYYELHATEFVRGKGSLGAIRPVPKGLRCRIFKETLHFITTLPSIKMMHVSLPLNKEFWAFERLLNRINKNMSVADSHALLICDDGKEDAYTRLVRRMGVFNPIQSKYGQWADGSLTKNLTVTRIIEDPVFKSSKVSYFIQLVDFCAYSLLRHDAPTEYTLRYGLEMAFQLLTTIGVPESSPRDPQFVIR